MERLKVRPDRRFDRACRDLHSSMERLKGWKSQPYRFVPVKFTFQYGEIKSAKIFADTIADTRFTFQYGEIKSYPGD